MAMTLLVPLLLILGAEATPPAEADDGNGYPEQTGYAIGAPLAVGLTVAGPAETPNVHGELYLGLRPSFTVSPAGLKNLGFGIYGEVATLRTFKDLHLAGGVQLATPGELWVRFVPSVGAFASRESRQWAPGVEAGLFFGIHGAYTGSAGTLGLRLSGRAFIANPVRWTVTLALEIDAWLITTLVAWIAK